MNVLKTIWLTLENTPWWVYLILYYCIRIGVKSSKYSITSLPKLLIIPMIFVAMSIHTLLTAFAINPTTIISYSIALAIGTILGMVLLQRQQVEIDRQALLVASQGTWLVLIIIMIIFISKYYFGYSLAVYPPLAQNRAFEISMLVISAITSGMFLGRALYLLYRLASGPFTQLRNKNNNGNS